VIENLTFIKQLNISWSCIVRRAFSCILVKMSFVLKPMSRGKCSFQKYMWNSVLHCMEFSLDLFLIAHQELKDLSCKCTY